jgi:hypothetical protein
VWRVLPPDGGPSGEPSASLERAIRGVHDKGVGDSRKEFENPKPTGNASPSSFPAAR